MEKEVFVINTGKTKGTTFKIKVKDLAFSSFFDTGAQVSCIKYDTVSELDLLHLDLGKQHMHKDCKRPRCGCKGINNGKFSHWIIVVLYISS